MRWWSWWPRRADVSLGRRGERHARAWLAQQGYRVYASNVAVGRDEADIVAIAPDGRTLVIVEVKTRSQAGRAPELSITQAKRDHLTRLAVRMMRRRAFRGLPVRFDVIAIVWPKEGEPTLRHHPAAFESRY